MWKSFEKVQQRENATKYTRENGNNTRLDQHHHHQQQFVSTLIFAQSRVEARDCLDVLVKQLDRVGLVLNPEKTVVVTNEAQPPQTVKTTAGVILGVLPRDGGQRWLVAS